MSGSTYPEATPRVGAFLEAAEASGWLAPKDRHLGGRVSSALVERAKQASGITSDTELLTYALTVVALEDDFAQRLLALEGSVPKDALSFFDEE
ncbi:MAG: hypothetical protein K2X11_07310 [Acetobacteraceae bacterium]|nr:hypothetical protein [Acetobacteraceae bacterium]